MGKLDKDILENDTSYKSNAPILGAQQGDRVSYTNVEREIDDDGNITTTTTTVYESEATDTVIKVVYTDGTCTIRTIVKEADGTISYDNTMHYETDPYPDSDEPEPEPPDEPEDVVTVDFSTNDNGEAVVTTTTARADGTTNIVIKTALSSGKYTVRVIEKDTEGDIVSDNTTTYDYDPDNPPEPEEVDEIVDVTTTTETDEENYCTITTTVTTFASGTVLTVIKTVYDDGTCSKRIITVDPEGNVLSDSTDYYDFDPDDSDDERDYEIKDAKNLRTFIICKSSELPTKYNRNKNSVYFVYDKMELHVYQSLYTDPFCIVEQLNPKRSYLTEKMLYISMTGNIYSYASFGVIRLAKCSDGSQLDILKSCGSFYFMNAESRYLDKQTRTLILPYQNGSYQLSLSLPENIMIDDDTVIKFNTETDQFYIAGKEYQFEDKLNNIGKYSGLNTNTVINTMDSNTFKSEIKISKVTGNGIRALPSGLFVSTYKLATQSDYEALRLYWVNFKNIMNNYISELMPIVENATEGVSATDVINKVQEGLDSYDANIMSMISEYSNYSNRISTLETLAEESEEKIDSYKEEIIDYLNSFNSVWESLEPVGSNRNNPRDLEMYSTVLGITREVILKLRSNNTEEEVEPIQSTGTTIPNAVTSRPGLSLDETAIENYVMSRYRLIEDKLNNNEAGIEYPDTGNSG